MSREDGHAAVELETSCRAWSARAASATCYTATEAVALAPCMTIGDFQCADQAFVAERKPEFAGNRDERTKP